jgi:hypothetical protein
MTKLSPMFRRKTLAASLTVVRRNAGSVNGSIVGVASPISLRSLQTILTIHHQRRPNERRDPSHRKLVIFPERLFAVAHSRFSHFGTTLTSIGAAIPVPLERQYKGTDKATVAVALHVHGP